MPNILKTIARATTLLTAIASLSATIDQSIENKYIVEANGEVVGTLDIRRSSRGESYDELQLEKN